MPFTPKNEDELQKDILLEPGDYDFEVIGAESSISKSGSPMLHLTIAVYSKDGAKNFIDDYIVDPSSFSPGRAQSFVMRQLRHFCAATGLLKSYNQGLMPSPEECLGKSGRCKIGIEDKNPQYAPRNVIRDYLSESSDTTNRHQSQPQPQRKEKSNDLDEIVF